MKTKYELVKKNKYKKYIEINLGDSYNIKKTKDNKGTIKFYDEKIISHVIKKSFDNKIKKILELLIEIEESDSDPSEGYLIVLNEEEKLKRELENKHKKNLKKEQLEFLNKKIELMEIEIKNKLLSIQIINNAIYNSLENSYENDDYEEEIVSNRRR